MSLNQYINKKKEIQERILDYLDSDDNIEENYQNVLRLIKDQQILEDKAELKSFLYIISNIANNHKRSPSFITKIEKMLKHCQSSLNSLLSKKVIFDIFQENKRIILFLIKEKIVVIDEIILAEMESEKLENYKYKEYFLPEISYAKAEKGQSMETGFDEKRKKGENDQYLCQLVRHDSINEFKEYINQNKIALDSKIEKSIFETNPFLIENQPTIIEYAAFFGSYEIFNYLIKSGAKLTKSIWIYAIHGKNNELFKLLDENHIQPEDESYEECLEESIKCHHNDIANIIINNLLDEKVEKINRENNEQENLYAYCFHYYNFLFFPETLDNKFIIHYLIDFDYFDLFKLYLSRKNIDNYIPYIKYAKKIDRTEYYNFLTCLKSEESKPIEKSIPTATQYNNINLSYDNDTYRIGSASFKFKPIKSYYFLALHEAFSCSPDEAHFLKSSEIFKNIVESKVVKEYYVIAKDIQEKCQNASESSTCRNELTNLISSLCQNISNYEINKLITDCGGMINYVIPLLYEKRILAPKNITINITEPFIAAGLILFYHEVVKSDLYKNTPFSFWKIMSNKTIKLTRIAYSRILSSNNPSIILLFGLGRTGKSTIASQIISGMNCNLKKTLFKSSASIEACTHNINALGPIKCSELAKSYELDNNKYHANMNRDVFIVDSEGVESFDETPWLEQALFAMFPINTISFYVSKMYNPGELEKYTKYLNLIQIIGGIKINHGFGYILNRGTFDGNKVLDQLLNQNAVETKKIIQNYSDSSLKLDQDHSKYFTVLDFIEHHDDFFLSLKEVVKFIVNMIINEGLLMTGSMMIEMLEKFTIKANENQYLRNHGQTFENLFLQIIDDRMKKSIESQRNSIEKNVSDKIEPFLVQDMGLDVDSCLSKIDQNSIINNVMKIAIDNTLPTIPQKYPYLIDSSKSKAMDIIRSSIANSKQKIINKNAMEVQDLGNGYSIEDGSFKMKVFSLKNAPYLYEKDFGNGVRVAYRLPEYVTMDFVPTRYQHSDYKLRTSANNFVLEMVSKIAGGKGFQLSASKFGIDKINHFANSLLGVTFSTNSPNTEISISVNVNAIAKVSFNGETNLKNHLVPDLKSRFDDLERMLRSYDVKSPQIQNEVSRIFQDYGESVAVKFYIGCYEIAISNNSGIRFESGGQNAFASSSCKSSGINLGSKLRYGGRRSRDKSNVNSQYSGVLNISSNGTVIACGNSSNPATFMVDIVKNPISNNESSFAPLSRFASSDSVQKALDYWSGRWNLKPKTIHEYLTCYNLNSLPANDTIVLYKDNMPLNLTVKDGKIVLPDSEIIYRLYRVYDNKVEIDQEEHLDVYIDPGDMSIGNLTKNLYVKIWKNRTGHHKRADGTETLSLKIILGPLWKFEYNITPAYFIGDAFNNLIINNPDSHFLSVDFTRPIGPEGKSYPEEIHYLQLQQKLKVKLA